MLNYITNGLTPLGQHITHLFSLATNVKVQSIANQSDRKPNTQPLNHDWQTVNHDIRHSWH